MSLSRRQVRAFVDVALNLNVINNLGDQVVQAVAVKKADIGIGPDRVMSSELCAERL